MKSAGPALGKTAVIYSRGVKNMIYVGFDETLNES